MPPARIGQDPDRGGLIARRGRWPPLPFCQRRRRQHIAAAVDLVPHPTDEIRLAVGGLQQPLGEAVDDDLGIDEQPRTDEDMARVAALDDRLDERSGRDERPSRP